MSGRLESAIEAACVAHAIKHGCYPIKLAMTTVGLPDRMFLLPRGWCWLVEFKGPRGRLSPRQRLVFVDLGQRAHPVSVIRTLSTFQYELAQKLSYIGA